MKRRSKVRTMVRNSLRSVDQSPITAPKTETLLRNLNNHSFIHWKRSKIPRIYRKFLQGDCQGWWLYFAWSHWRQSQSHFCLEEPAVCACLAVPVNVTNKCSGGVPYTVFSVLYQRNVLTPACSNQQGSQLFILIDPHYVFVFTQVL